MYDPEQGYPIPIGKAVESLAQSRQQLTPTSNDSAERLELAATYAKMLLGCYRAGEANDPEVYTAAIIAVLCKYGEDVMRRVVDPADGLPSRCQWLPTVKEVRDACAECSEATRRSHEPTFSELPLSRQKEIAQQQLEEERALQAALALAAPRRETWEETKADLVERGFNFSEKPKPAETAWDVRNRLGITEAEWDAIPNLPVDHEVKSR